MKEFGISVHFSNKHHNYFSAWRYVTKCDREFTESPNHPYLGHNREPQTSSASRARHSQHTKSTLDENEDGYGSDSEQDSEENPQVTSLASKRRKKRRSPYEVSEIIVETGIKTLTELQALAFEQKEAGKTDLAEFLITRSPKVVADILNSAWDIQAAPKKLARARKSRMDILEEAKEGNCAEGCNGEWLDCAKEVLQNNGLSVAVFREAVSDALIKGRGKYRNLMIVGAANCGKSFLFNPLTAIYNTFCNPASGSFAWVGVDSAECIFLNDFRWSPQLIPWHDLLLLLEGHVVHLPAPKTHFAKDISLTADTPIFCTGKRPLMYIKNGLVDERETEMMNVRWRIFYFNFQIPREQQREIPPCARCFASLICGEPDLEFGM